MSEMTDPGPASARPVATDYDAPLEACPLCGCGHLCDHHEDDKQRRIQRCTGCEVQLMNPQYNDNYLENYYSSYIRVEPETAVVNLSGFPPAVSLGEKVSQAGLPSPMEEPQAIRPPA